MAIHVGRRELIVILGRVAAVRSRVFLLSVAFVLSQAFPSFASAQQIDKVPNIGIAHTLGYNVAGIPPGSPGLGISREQEHRHCNKSAEGNSDRFPELARELARLNVNVMVVGGDQGLRAAKDATATIPIIVLACDPLDSLVVSIARPGGKATGLTCISSELAGKGFSCSRSSCHRSPTLRSCTIRRIATRNGSTSKVKKPPK